MVRTTVTSYADQRIHILVISQRVMTRGNLSKIIEKFELFKIKLKKEGLVSVLESMRENINLKMISAEIVDLVKLDPYRGDYYFSFLYQTAGCCLVHFPASIKPDIRLMERLQKALEKARRERTSAAPKQERAINPGVPGPSLSIGIEYTQTQIIPISPLNIQNNRVLFRQQDAPVIDAYKVLRTKLLQKLKDKNWNTVAVTSPTQGAGKTLTTVNLAISLAMEMNYTVLLVDLNLKQPSIHKYFGIEVYSGISDYLLSNTPIGNLLINPGIDGLVFLPVGDPIHHSSEMLSAPRMLHLINELKDRYTNRIIIFDMPSILPFDDVLVLLPYVDSSILVVEESVNTPDQIRHCLETLEGEKFLGTVLNKSTLPRQNYYY